MLKAKEVHCVGIGGIGVSAIARMFLQEGARVSGSDTSSSEITKELESLGAQINFYHEAKNISPGCDLVIYTNALSKENPEILEAKKRKIKTISYPEALGEISRAKFVIAVSGSAGKTTTTAIIGQLLIDAGLDPTVIVGSLAYFKNRSGHISKTNFFFGRSKYFVVEADEYRRAFLNLSPKILAINNIEPDHLDYYRDLLDLQSAFAELASKVPTDGLIVCSPGDKFVSPVLGSARATILDYSSVSIPSNFSLPGKHNRDNARVAITVASILGIDMKAIKKSLSEIKSPWRRLEYKGRTKGGAPLYDDYAHNPQKVRALIAGIKETFPDKKIIMIFQPHLYSRTKQLIQEFAKSFNGVDRLIILPIYAARETPDETINHNILARAISSSGQVKKVETINSFNELPPLIATEGKDSVCLTVGAGDLYTAGDLLLDK